MNQFKWVPLHIRSPFPPKPVDNRMAIFWLAREGDRDGGALWFVNESHEVLDYIKVRTDAIISVDEPQEGFATGIGKYHIFKQVLVGEAIQIEKFDGFYDLDYCFMISVEINAPKYPKTILQTEITKGGVHETVLLWNTVESGKTIGYKVKGCNLQHSRRE